MRLTGKIFRNGRSQAVRLPKECRFKDDQKEVIVRREGNRIILEPIDEWPDQVLDCIGKLDRELNRIPQVPLKELDNPLVDE